jgi:RNA polymerase-binding transcription factor DksA
MSSKMRTLERSKLSQSRKEALTEVEHLRQEIMIEIDSEVDEADEQITEHETASILIEMLEDKVKEIESALAAIELGRYEICERCGKPIESQRLAAKPYARLCISCQEEVERLEM